MYAEQTLPKRRAFDRDIAGRVGTMLAKACRPLENDALDILSGRVSGDALSATQWETVGGYLAALTIESYSTDEDEIELCPRCSCILVRQQGNFWICSGALFETDAIREDCDVPSRPLSDRIWTLADQPEELRRVWEEMCGGSRVYLPSGGTRRVDFTSLLPDQLPWAFTFDELVARMTALYMEAAFSMPNSTVRPKHLRAALDRLRTLGVVRVVVGKDGQPRYQRVR
jgi:hypothetical protein